MGITRQKPEFERDVCGNGRRLLRTTVLIS